jgi:quercetin dioxygenase-like cupin family protein
MLPSPLPVASILVRIEAEPMTIHTSTEILDFLGAQCRVIADAATTGGRYGLVDMIETPAGDMTPLHVHQCEDEGFLVLDGEVTLFLPGREVTLRPGEFFLAPRGVPHTRRIGDTAARMLVLSSPAGFEQFVSEVAALDDRSPEALGAVGARHAIEMLGPPGMMP